MASDTTGQSIPDDPHRPDGPRMPPSSSSVEYRKCLKCSKAKPLQGFKSQRKARSYYAINRVFSLITSPGNAPRHPLDAYAPLYFSDWSQHYLLGLLPLGSD
ncbi:hypothetical protein E4U37_008278 [Claviceps purpurea]|nr:hypothetical protein E4U37_008278 [Claviceps purpurea]